MCGWKAGSVYLLCGSDISSVVKDVTSEGNLAEGTGNLSALFLQLPMNQ